MNPVSVIFRRELSSYFNTPVAYVFIVIFLVLASAFAFQLGGLFERGQADLKPFLIFIPGCICSWCRPWPCACGRRSATPARSSCC